MARPEITGCTPSETGWDTPEPHARGPPKKKPRKRRVRGPPTYAFTIQEFCDAHRLSRSHYYNLKRDGLGPAETRLGDRVVITIEAATRWRKAREKATAA